jgi:hypothetical protein
MSAQLAPAVSQRRHWYAYEVGLLDHVPVEAVNTCPCCAAPLTTGNAVFAGGDATVPSDA